MSVSDNGECLVGNLDSFLDVLIRKCGIYKVVVVICEEYAALDALGG